MPIHREQRQLLRLLQMRKEQITMKRLILAILTVSVPLAGCMNRQESKMIPANDSCFHIISMNPDDIPSGLQFFNLSEIADTVEYIPLQTSTEAMVGEVEKMIVHKEKIYIWDQLSESVFCFDTSGNYLFRISAHGQGPGEYLRTQDFALNLENDHICIFSDVDQAIFEYDTHGKFVKEIPSTYILQSFALRGNILYEYTGRFANEYPDTDGKYQFRFNVIKDGQSISHQLPYIHKEELYEIPMSTHNFTTYKDTLLLSESLSPLIYTVAKDGTLTPRYRIEFTTNKYNPSFEDEHIDIKRMRLEEKEGNLTKLGSALFENDRYIFFNYTRGLVGTAYVNKRDNSVHNIGFFTYSGRTRRIANEELKPSVLSQSETPVARNRRTKQSGYCTNPIKVNRT